jgi:hypothetical protein
MVNAQDVVPVLDIPIFKKNGNVTLVDASGDKIVIGIQDSSKAHEIPDTVAGFEVIKVNFPRMKAVDCDSCSPTCDPKRIVKTRPIIGGISVAHFMSTAGTIGAIVVDSENKAYILSNNHVLALASTLQNVKAEVGNSIRSPGPGDGGSVADTVANLYDWVPIDEEDINYVDAAIAEITTDYQQGWLGDSRGVVIYPNGISAEVSVGDTCYKYGRTTGYTENIIISANASISVEYEGGMTAHFRNQIIFISNPAYADPLCAGDSGSGLLNTKWQLVGLCFAGGQDDYGTIIGTACYISPIFETFGVTLPEPEESNPMCDPGTTKCISGRLFACNQWGNDWTEYGPATICGAENNIDFVGGYLKTIAAMLPFAFVLGIIMTGKGKK